MAEAGVVVCTACGAKIKAGRTKCLRCGEILAVAPPPAVAAPPAKWNEFAVQHRGRLTLAGAAISLVAVLVVVASLGQEPAQTPPSVSTTNGAKVRSAEVSAIRGAATTQAPARTEPHTELDAQRNGTAAYARGDFNGAIDSYRQAVAKNPNSPLALNNLGQALVRVGQGREALPIFERAVALSPNEWAPRFNLAHAHEELGDWPKAITEYQRAAELFPDDYVTHYNLGMVLHKAGREEPAVAEFRRAIDLAPSEASFRLSLGISYERLQRRADAANAYEEYLTLAPNAADAARVKARIETLRSPAQG